MADSINKTWREQRRDRNREAVKLANAQLIEQGQYDFKAVLVGDQIHVVPRSDRDKARIIDRVNSIDTPQE